MDRIVTTKPLSAEALVAKQLGGLGARGHRWTKGSAPRKQPGMVSHRKREVRELALNLVTDPAYLANLYKRIVAGKAPHMEITLWHYAFGKPTDRVRIEAEGHAPAISQAAEQLKLRLQQLAARVRADAENATPSSGATNG
jgi:hypothetical protein